MNTDLSAAIDTVDIRFQYVFSNIFVLRIGGLVEESVLLTLEEYAHRRSSGDIKKFIAKKIRYMNSFDSEKIKGLLDEFDTAWWSKISNRAGQECVVAIDSIKAIRDKVAHGAYNGTGFSTIAGYYREVRKLPAALDKVILGP